MEVLYVEEAVHCCEEENSGLEFANKEEVVVLGDLKEAE